jgi:hypothetical protein
MQSVLVTASKNIHQSQTHVEHEKGIILQNLKLYHKIKKKVLPQCIKCNNFAKNNFNAPVDGRVSRNMLCEV